MTTIKTLICVSLDGRIEGIAPPGVPAAEHEVMIVVPSRPRYRVADLPVHPSGWDALTLLRREDLDLCSSQNNAD